MQDPLPLPSPENAHLLQCGTPAPQIEIRYPFLDGRFCSGEGNGAVRGWGGRFLIENPRRGGGSPGGGGARRGLEGVWREFGGGAKYFFSGPKFPPSFGWILTDKPATSRTRRTQKCDTQLWANKRDPFLGRGLFRLTLRKVVISGDLFSG